MGLAIKNLRGLRRRSDSAMKRFFCGGLLLLAAACGLKSDSPAPVNSTSTSTSSATPNETSQTPGDFKTASGVEMVLLPGGEFTMGSNQGNSDDTPAHKVTLTGFAID